MIGLALVFGGVDASAMVVDRLNCESKLTDTVTGESVESKQDVNLIRKVSTTTPADRVITEARSELRLDLKTNAYTLNAGMDLSVYHGVLLDHSGKVIDSRQSICSAERTGFCENGPQGECELAAQLCARPSDPFGSIDGWQHVGVFENSITPEFVGQNITFRESYIVDFDGNIRGKYQLTCSYLGTDFDAKKINDNE